MKKLNQTELKILAKRIAAELKKKGDELQSILNAENDKINLPEAQRALRQIKRLSPTAKAVLCTHHCSSVKGLTEKDLLRAMRVPQNVYQTHFGYGYIEIIEALTLGQINSPDVESLCNSVAQQFVKK